MNAQIDTANRNLKLKILLVKNWSLFKGNIHSMGNFIKMVANRAGFIDEVGNNERLLIR